jgi:hypothetical protein
MTLGVFQETLLPFHIHLFSSWPYSKGLGLAEDPDKTIDCFHWVNLWCFLVYFYTHETLILEKFIDLIDWFLVFNANFNNISAISWRPVLVVEEAGVPGENNRPWASNWLTYLRCGSSASFFVIYKARRGFMPYWW